MASFKDNPATVEEVLQWIELDKLINPRTGDETIKGKSSYKYLSKAMKEFTKQGLLNKDPKLDNDIVNDIDFDIEKIKSDYELELKKHEEHAIEESKIKSKYKIEYTMETVNDYISLRKSLICPISYMSINTKNSFPFAYIWDPYCNGLRTDEDPHGPLWFDPKALTYYFWSKRLDNLWMKGDQEFGGTYGEAVGVGDDFYIPGRGHHPEHYLFRLPVPNLYLPKDYNPQYPTATPILTNAEIEHINKLVHSDEHSTAYLEIFKRYPPDLVKIKQYYDIAISKDPPIKPPIGKTVEDLTSDEIEALKAKANRDAVEMLKHL